MFEKDPIFNEDPRFNAHEYTKELEDIVSEKFLLNLNKSGEFKSADDLIRADMKQHASVKKFCVEKLVGKGIITSHKAYEPAYKVGMDSNNPLKDLLYLFKTECARNVIESNEDGIFNIVAKWDVFKNTARNI